jgi:HAD superfamily hydrolase (TIGR01549 family)
MVKAIVFDFGQTLADAAGGFRAAEKKAEVNLYSRLGVTPWDEFLSQYRQVRKAFQERSEFSRRAMWAQVLTSYGVVPDEGCLAEWEGEYWGMVEAETALFPETMDVLRKLSVKYRLAVITNTRAEAKSGQHRFSRFPGLEKLFHIVIVAGESGVPPKPDPVPFRLCLENLGIASSESVYVGDDWRIDVCGARDVGMQPIWLQHHSVRRSWPLKETSVPVITSLDPLLDMETLLAKG